MEEYKHSVFLEREKCKGCTACLKRCPTEAIRIRDGHAVINPLDCIDCGECIRVCEQKAKRAVYDKLDDLDQSKYLIALPAPSLFGQFTKLTDADYVVQGLLDIGFNDVFEVAKGAEIVTEYTRRYMNRKDIPLPVISSACPAVVRLIKLRFPTLIKHLLPIIAPMEIAGKYARREAMRKHPELKSDDIRTVFISPCPAKVSWVKSTMEDQEVYVDHVVSASEVYFRLIGAMKRGNQPKASSETGMIGLSWASSGGEASALFNEGYLAADGIENVIQVLDKIETGQLGDVTFIELNACPGGCVGGAMTVENPYIARVRLQSLRRYLPVSMNRLPHSGEEPDTFVPDELIDARPFAYTPPAVTISRMESIRRMMEIENIYETLPQIDCGSCGAPTCRCFAEDVVRGEAHIDDCVVMMREHLKSLLEKQNGEN
ncbi:MAG: 4Fe-4S dicluster domain-containing protein [Clostridia bacterium]|nr:4Fe-4S dicluster domain-containing protein [Clostridia bacterium]MBQ2191109.1 4Fe-4S dicluster domain-containing protein [Clostridia bacterium]MBQ3938458.1 4Fe-4S dicluster domain-containing protein [Clostridia bacterium]MBQ5487718.1 4Fe-4S dicluster domain-containing protein [Clostridia bacterium]MBR4635331.1 4Fe-4S dicluster domain-containing protein [Clostridia bacterium]